MGSERKCDLCWQLTPEEARKKFSCWDYDNTPSRCHKRRSDAKTLDRRVDHQAARRKLLKPHFLAIKVAHAEIMADVTILENAIKLLERRKGDPHFALWAEWVDRDWVQEFLSGLAEQLKQQAIEGGVRATDLEKFLSEAREADTDAKETSVRGRLVARGYVHTAGPRKGDPTHAIVVEMLLNGQVVATRATHAHEYSTAAIKRWIRGVLDEWKVRKLVTDRPVVVPTGSCPLCERDARDRSEEQIAEASGGTG